jgi:hypothetical protein
MIGSILFGLVVLVVFAIIQTIKPGKSMFDK